MSRFTIAKLVLFIVASAPLAWLIASVVIGDPGPDPVAAIVHALGIWALRLLIATLAITPLRRITDWPHWIRFRRMLGLFAFAYASLHLAAYALLDLGGDLAHLSRDIVKRPYITVGFAAWLLMVPLAVTSTQAMMRRLGKRWLSLHRAVYAVAVLAVLHFLWLVKADLSRPLTYAAVFAVLFAARWRGFSARTSAMPPR